MATQTKPVIGLTGGIASGKSSVARMLRELGVEVIDADQIAREVVALGTDGLREIVDTFGAGVLDPSGALDRAKVAEIVFRDTNARQKLNAIVHPRIGRLSAERIAAAQRGPSPYVVYEAPLLVETGAHRGLSALIVVAAAEPLQLARSMARDGMDEAAAHARIAAQLPLSAKVEAADYVVANDGDLEALRVGTMQTHRAILERFAGTAVEA
jgi:dephospho-CoA kinase